MKRNDCPCCRSNNIKPFINEFEKGYDLYTCKSCSVIFSNPFESAKADFYTNAKDVASKTFNKLRKETMMGKISN